MKSLGPLFDRDPRDEGESGKQEGMNRVENNASSEFREAAEASVYQYALHNPTVTVNDMWDGLQALGVGTRENRASGPVMTRCAKRGWIEKTDRVGRTNRATRHSGNVAIWRSLIFQQEAA